MRSALFWRHLHRIPEQAAPDSGRNIPNGIPFHISVDGVPIDGSLGTAEDDQRTVDVALDRMDVQLTFDGLKLDKAANIQANKAGAKVGEEVVFTPYWNYGSFIERAEVRIFRSDASTDGRRWRPCRFRQVGQWAGKFPKV